MDDIAAPGVFGSIPVESPHQLSPTPVYADDLAEDVK